MNLVIVTGMSGAGKSQAIKCLEDMDFYCVDNMPPVLIPKFAEICYSSKGKIENAALVIDSRGGEMFKEIPSVLEELSSKNIVPEILFIEASDEVLIKRYKETRRKHPLSQDGKIIDGINRERILLSSLRKHATHIIDTSKLKTNQLKEELINIFVGQSGAERITIDVMSFGFKYGIPADADLVFDVRFLPNPFYIEELKYHTGLEKSVQDFVCGWPQTVEFMKKLYDMVEFLLPYYLEEGKSQLVIAIGCTGGMHRSVTMAEKLYDKIKESGRRVIKHHRDLENDSRR